MNRKERTEQKMQELFHSHAAGNEGTDGPFMQILQGYIFGDVCYTGSLDNRMRELVTVTVLTTLSALPQLKAHVGASLNAGCTPVEIREAVYQCAPFIGFPKTLNAISTMNEVFTANGIDLPLPDQTTLTGEREDERYQKGLEIQEPLYGDEIADRYTWLPGEFAPAVPRFLTELCFGDFNTREGLEGKTPGSAHRGAAGGPGRGGGAGEKPCGGRPESGQHQRGSGLRPGPRQRLYGLPPAVQRPECEQRAAAERGVRGRLP